MLEGPLASAGAFFHAEAEAAASGSGHPPPPELLRRHWVSPRALNLALKYVERAVQLGLDTEALHRLRAHVETRVEGAELFDMQRLARNIELAFEQMVEREQRGLPPASFTVGDAPL